MGALVEQPSLPGLPPRSSELTPMGLLQQVIQTQNPKDAVEVVRELVKLQMDMRKQDAEEDFNDAMTRCQSEIRIVVPDASMSNDKSKKWATFKALDAEVRPIYSRYGFSVSWNTAPHDVPDQMLVLADVSKGLHTRHYQIPMDISGKGAKGGDVMAKPQAIGAGMSFAKRYLLAAIWNIPIGEELSEAATNGWLGERMEWIANCRDEAELTRIFNQAFSEAKKDRAAQSMLLLVEARDKRKKELS